MEDKNYESKIYLSRYNFRDRVMDEVKALEIKAELLEEKKSKLEAILKQHNDSANVKAHYIYNVTNDEYSIEKLN